LGAGILTTAGKKQKASAADMDAAVASMARLSGTASGLFREAHPHVHALTDVTGFSLIGHAHEMAHLSKLALRFTTSELPLLPGAEGYAKAGLVTGGAKRNASHYGPFVTFADSLAPWQLDILYDPQTSGPLLAAVDPAHAGTIVAAFRAAGEPVWIVGEAFDGIEGGIEIGS
jgi:selenide,water dikinase